MCVCGQAIEIYLHLVAQMRDKMQNLPDVLILKNSFFYTKLLQDGYVYANVKNWTRQMGDLLTRDKILVPINKDANHWVSATRALCWFLIISAAGDGRHKHARQTL